MIVLFNCRKVYWLWRYCTCFLNFLYSSFSRDIDFVYFYIILFLIPRIIFVFTYVSIHICVETTNSSRDFGISWKYLLIGYVKYNIQWQFSLWDFFNTQSFFWKFLYYNLSFSTLLLAYKKIELYVISMSEKLFDNLVQVG